MANVENDAFLVGKTKYFSNLVNLPHNVLPEKLRNHFRLLYTNVRPHKKFHNSCEYCLTEWNDKNCHVKIQPVRQPGPAVANILNRVKKGQKLSKIEKKLAMRVSKGNIKIIKCLLCQKETKIRLKNPIKESKTQLLPPAPEFTLPAKKKKKKNAILRTDNTNFLILDSTAGTSDNNTNVTVLENKTKRKKNKNLNVSILAAREKLMKKKKNRKGLTLASTQNDTNFVILESTGPSLNSSDQSQVTVLENVTQKPKISSENNEGNVEMMVIDSTYDSSFKSPNTIQKSPKNKKKKKKKSASSQPSSESSFEKSTDFITIDGGTTGQPSDNKPEDFISIVSGPVGNPRGGFARRGRYFSPLEASTPLVKAVVNDVLGLQTLSPIAKNSTIRAKKKRLSSLQKLLAEDSAKKQPQGKNNSLKGFLSRL